MCGIIGYTGKRQAAPVLLEGLKRLEYRGYDSAGIAVEKNGRLHISKVSGRIANLCEKTENGVLLPGCSGIGHTRWATHGAPTDVNAHPHMSCDGQFSVVHNGIIENYLPLREELMSKGYSFASQTDTEVIVHLLEMYYEGSLKECVMKTAARLEGSYALGVLCADHPGKLVAVREASPLILGIGVGENFFASDVTALVSYTRNALYLEDGEFAEITPENINVFNCTGAVVHKPVSRITWSIEAAEKGGYEHFMLKEIMEQPRAVKAALTPRIQNGRIHLDDFAYSADELQKIDKIMITACGSAYYAGCAGKYTLEKLTHLPVDVQLASELRYAQPQVDDHTLLIVLSQSGETADTIAAMKECQRLGAKTLAIVNVVGSTIAKLADHTLYTWAGPEIAVATTKGYTTQLTVLYLLAVFIGYTLKWISDAEHDRLLAELEMLPKRIQETLHMNSKLSDLAEKFRTSQSIFFIGRNTDYAAALEGALKMKEISYIHAEAYAAGELKHGTIALIDEGQHVIALCCNESIAEKTMNNIVEVKARGAQVLAISEKGNRAVFSHADNVICIPSIDPLFQIVVELIPLQLLAYHTAKVRECDIDKPKNLAKSVTVE